MKWQMWSRFKDLNNKELHFAGGHLGRLQIERYIYDAAQLKGYPQERVIVEGFTDQWLAWTIDSGGHKRKFLSLNPA